YEHEEIAKMLGCAVGTTKSQLHKARMKVRSLLAYGKGAVAKPRKTRSRLTSHFKIQVPSLASGNKA
ncbi:MAG TPA: sigma factor-like helix-turn-helix DNA-binding protein, partial [Pyrinomonadaceae bacterium]